jgi:hypothetical protein
MANLKRAVVGRRSLVVGKNKNNSKSKKPKR